MAGFTFLKDTNHRYWQLQDHHDKDEYLRRNDFFQAYEMMNVYDHSGAGTLSSFNWSIPEFKGNGGNYSFDQRNGRILYEDADYDSLTPQKKRLAHKYLDQFVAEFLKAYDDNYNF